MPKGRMTITALLLALVGLPVLRADDKKEENPFEAYVKAGRVGPMHKKLHRMVGDWTYEGKLWMTPGQEPLAVTGDSKRTLILGGRFVRDEVTSESLGGFKGISLIGYDNVREKYVNTWIDSMSTSITMMTGSVDETDRVWTFRGEHIDPVSKKKIQVRDVISMLGDNKQVIQSFHKPAGAKEEMKVMEMTYQRKKK